MSAESVAESSERDTSEPLAWYDTTAHSWVIRIVDGEDGPAIVPLEIRWYDVPRPLVEIAAAQVIDAGR